MIKGHVTCKGIMGGEGFIPLFQRYVLVRNFDQKPAISLKTLEIGFFNRILLTKSRIWGAAEAPKSFL